MPLMQQNRCARKPYVRRGAMLCLGQLQMSWCWLITSVVVLGRFYHAAAALALRFLD